MGQGGTIDLPLQARDIPVFFLPKKDIFGDFAPHPQRNHLPPPPSWIIGAD